MSSAHRPSSTLKNRTKLSNKKFNPSNTAPVASAFNKEIIKHKVNIANKLSTTTRGQLQNSGTHSNNDASENIDTHQYHTDLNVANWQSESKRSFHPLDKSQVDYTHSHRPSASGNPLVRDPVYDADMWQSEYEQRCAALRQRQSELLASAGANSEEFTAGVRSASHGTMPPNYAWDGQNDTQDRGLPRYNMGTSEHKVQYKWPEQQDAFPVAPTGAGLNIFRSAADPSGDAFQHARGKSVSGEAYVAHDLRDIARGAEDRKEAAQREKEQNPMSFAWPSSNENNDAGISDSGEPRHGLHKQHHLSTRDDYAPDAPFSEYTRDYTWKISDPSNQASPAKRGAAGGGEDLNLFRDTSADKGMHGATSEYKRMFLTGYDVLEDFHRHNGEASAGRASHQDPSIPTQFAWPRPRDEREEDDHLDASRKRRHGPVNPNVQSEYATKYKWHDPETRTVTVPARNGVDGDQPHGSAIIGLYEGELSHPGWRSEYEENYTRKAHEQGQQQQEEPVAGMHTEVHAQFPMNYAWKESANAVPQSAPVSPPRRRPTEVVHSEHQDKFVKFDLTTAASAANKAENMIKKRVAEGENLNLFAEDAAAQSARQNRLSSEYNASYRAVDGDYRPAESTKRTQLFANPNPPQFAWSVLDGEAPPPPVVTRPKSSAPPPVSEYDSKFGWKVATREGKTLQQRQKDGTSIDPSGGAAGAFGDADAGADQWSSEYDDRMQKTGVLEANVVEPAGMSTTFHGSIPSFYAWPDEEKPVVTLPPRLPVEPVNSEYADRFVKWPAGKQPALIKTLRPAAASVNLNLFGGKTDTEVASEYDANFKKTSVQEAAQIRADVANQRKAASIDHNPTQFAWNLVDPERVKPVVVSSNASNTEPSEYDAKYRWPEPSTATDEALPANAKDAGKKGGARASTANLLGDDNASAAQWKSEYDAHCLEEETAPSPTSVAAGMATERHGAIPTFYAWTSPPVPPSVKPAATQFKAPIEPMFSEYDAAFTGGATERPVIRQPSTAGSLNLFSVGAKLNATSEYDAKFIPQPPQVEQSKAAAQLAAASAGDQSRPPQFAWTRGEPAPLVAPPPVKRPTHKFDETTEYDSRFVWPAEADIVASKTLAVPQSQLNRITPTCATSLTATDRAEKAANWQSEYDNRFTATSRAKGQNGSSAAADERVFGLPVPPAIEAPAFYAWKQIDNVPPLHFSADPARSMGNEESEYHAKYSWVAPANKEAVTDHTCDSFKHLSLVRGQPFTAVSEYDDAFRATAGSVGAAAHKHHVAESTLRRTNIEQRNLPVPAPAGPAAAGLTTTTMSADLLRKPTTAAPTVNVARPGHTVSPVKAKKPQKAVRGDQRPASYATESRDNYKWPKQKHAAPRSVSLSADKENVPWGNHGRSEPAADGGSITTKSTLTSAAAVDGKQHRRVHLTSGDCEDTVGSNAQALTDTSSQASASTQDTVVGSVGGASSSISSHSPANTNAAADANQASAARSRNYTNFVMKNRMSNSPNAIPGLRFPLDSYKLYRARSAPPRNRLAVTYSHDVRKSPRIFVDDSMSNPVLMHKRYPRTNDRQLNRWSTESGDNFRWRKTNTVATVAMV